MYTTTQYYCCAYEKEMLGQREGRAHREDNVKVHAEKMDTRLERYNSKPRDTKSRGKHKLNEARKDFPLHHFLSDF